MEMVISSAHVPWVTATCVCSRLIDALSVITVDVNAIVLIYFAYDTGETLSAVTREAVHLKKPRVMVVTDAEAMVRIKVSLGQWPCSEIAV